MSIFLCPALLDIIVFLVLFAVCYGAGERGMTLGQCAWLGGIFQITYMATSPLVGSILSRRNARSLLMGSVVTTMLAAAVCLLARGFQPIFWAMACLGIFIAFFFNSFQTFMRGEAPPGGLARATGLYTIAWSMGSGAGFLMSGSLYRLGPVVLTVWAVGIGIVVFLLLYSHRARPHDALSAAEHVDEAPGGDGSRERYVWAARLMIFTAMFVQKPLQAFYPALQARSDVAPVMASLPLVLHLFIQGICGYLMIGLQFLRYRRGPIFLVQAIAALLLGIMWLIPSSFLSAAGISMLGAWAGFAYFYAVYYASNSSRSSRNIGINEAVVGLGSFAGLFICEWFMRRMNNDALMYAVCAVALLLSATAQWFVIGNPGKAGMKNTMSTSTV